MIGGSILASRYARALFGLGQESGATERFLTEIQGIADLAAESPELHRVLFTPLHPREQRRSVLNQLALKLDLCKEVRAFLMILVDENRMALLPGIRTALRELVDTAAGRVEAIVRTARPLTPEQEAGLQRALSRRISAEVSLRTEVDPDLIGGVVARVGDLLFDGSVKTQLASLAEGLRKGAA